jgi:hypothetical protein
MKSFQKMDFRRNNSEHRPRRIIPASRMPPRYFFEKRPRRTQKILLDPGRRINKLSDDLFGSCRISADPDRKQNKRRAN